MSSSSLVFSIKIKKLPNFLVLLAKGLPGGAAAKTPILLRRDASDLPVAVGFGISTPEEVCAVWRFADAAVVGSAIVTEIEKLSGESNLVNRIGEFARSLIAPAD